MTETGGMEILREKGWKKITIIVEYLDREGVQGECGKVTGGRLNRSSQ